MPVAAVFVPSPPMLLPEYVGRVDPAAELRTRCVAAISASLGDQPDDPEAGDPRVVVVAGHSATADPVLTPLGVRVGRHLLALAGWDGPVDELVVPADGRLGEPRSGAGVAAEAGRHTVLLVVGDGSARRAEKAPGYLDERSFAVDETILAALATADTAALRALDPGICDELMVTGRAPLQAAAHRLRHVDLRGEVLWSGDPYGVMYWIARWRES